jgi:hypothetical protein
MNLFDRIRDAFQKLDICTQMANAVAKAYHDLTSPDTPYQPFGSDDQGSIAANMCSVYAVDSAANAITMVAEGKVTEDDYMASLRAIAEGSLAADELYVARQFANATWKACQPYRGLERLTRPVMTQFNLLPDDEVAKDDATLAAAAKALISAIEN